MMHQQLQFQLAYLTGPSIEVPGVVHHPVCAFSLKVRASNEKHGVVRFALARLIVEEKVAGECGSDVA